MVAEPGLDREVTNTTRRYWDVGDLRLTLPAAGKDPPKSYIRRLVGYHRRRRQVRGWFGTCAGVGCNWRGGGQVMPSWPTGRAVPRAQRLGQEDLGFMDVGLVAYPRKSSSPALRLARHRSRLQAVFRLRFDDLYR
jgi:hypothetical protein